MSDPARRAMHRIGMRKRGMVHGWRAARRATQRVVAPAAQRAGHGGRLLTWDNSHLSQLRIEHPSASSKHQERRLVGDPPALDQAGGSRDHVALVSRQVYEIVPPSALSLAPFDQPPLDNPWRWSTGAPSTSQPAHDPRGAEHDRRDPSRRIARRLCGTMDRAALPAYPGGARRTSGALPSSDDQ